MSSRASSPSTLSVRLRPDVSEQAQMTLSGFVRRKALEAAEVEVLERRIVTIPAKDWEAFEAWVARPAKTISALKRFARRA